MVDNKKDPNCGMPVTAGIEDTVHYNGKVYGFCSDECKMHFLKIRMHWRKCGTKVVWKTGRLEVWKWNTLTSILPYFQYFQTCLGFPMFEHFRLHIKNRFFSNVF